MYFRKKYIEKIRPKSYNNFKIKLKISFVNRAPEHQIPHNYAHLELVVL